MIVGPLLNFLQDLESTGQEFFTPWNSLALAVVTVVLAFYWRYIRVPSHLRGLEGTGPFEVLYQMAAKQVPLLCIHKDMMAACRNPGSGVMRDWFMGHRLVAYGPEAMKRVMMDPKTFGKEGDVILQESDLGKWFGRSVLMIDGAPWKTARRVCTPAFHHENLKGLPMACVKIVEDTVDVMATGKSVDVSAVMSRMTLDVLGETVFGHNFNSVLQPDNAVVATYHRIFKELLKPERFFFKTFNKYFGNKEKEARLRADIKEFDDFMYSMIDKKQKNPKPDGEPLDLLDMLLRSMSSDDPTMQLSRKELRDNVLTFFIAGHDTTASALSYVMWHLAHHPEVQAKAREEVDRVVGTSEITYELQGELSYVTMVIKESMRRLPSVPGVTRVAEHDTEINGVFVPKGAVVAVSMMCAHWNEHVWSNPDAFIPERFDPKTIAEEKRSPFAHVPFMAGPRVCMGNNFSLIEQRIFLATLLRKFKIRCADPNATLNSLKFKVDAISEASNNFLIFEPR